MICLPRSTYNYGRMVVARDAVDPAAALRQAIIEMRRAFASDCYRPVKRALRGRNHCVKNKRVLRDMQACRCHLCWVLAAPDAVSGTWCPNRRADVVQTGPNNCGSPTSPWRGSSATSNFSPSCSMCFRAT
jgi:hypothetical protein